MAKAAFLFSAIIFISLTIIAQTISFEKKKKLPRALFGMLSEVEDQNIYIIGGTSNKYRKDHFYVYNSILDNWLNISSTFNYFMKGGISSIAYLPNYRVMLVSGNTLSYDSFLCNSIVYDIDKYETTLALEHKLGNQNQSAVHYDENIYFIGEQSPFVKSSASSFYSLDPSDFSINHLEDLPIKAATKAVVIGSKLFAVGTSLLKDEDLERNYVAKKEVLAFNFSANSWNHFIDLDEPIQGHSIAKYKNYLFIIGGSESPDQIIMIDTSTKKVKKLKMNISANESTAVVINNDIHILGGINRGGFPTKKHYSINCDYLLKMFEEPLSSQK